ncbi:MAG: NAD(P)/FAD-dependent oxidoreductase [Cyanobacteria bacterium]|nr:NAD(P)/FAD-dependent oxidoreductase [Cyanobacteria bacterium CG_2015-16_32_12]NCO77981.1 NAD(P)/FAD-dependent oxidoreductase [Cyanobacteria bacterium CG_2015-22_32_23]NCQ04448.1 NAD(P)/FAD-dependent oxidoreductase [Cyanobacteria bacterium CG_2015-09_32_10]NCQ40705.1 NAD(P)/FAD-dependent oxidoreductase [Cyanobacteria bacterium CG_2015-04_32_10]NCS85298.1 NAD(P)/FAD-dependent oxidoreductase [Cyanobacteria bacterium CG_2015-02_32_10]
MYNSRKTSDLPHVVIVGGGFAGLYAAKELGKALVKVTLIDKRNFHLFQPLLYQVATGSLSPAEICSPLRLVVGKNKNTHVILDEVIDINPEEKQVIMREGILNYDYLIIGTGVSHHYFGNDQWEKDAPGLKSIENALDIRRKIFLAFEEAEKVSSMEEKEEWLTFAIVGGGPTGVELAGAIAEIAHRIIKDDFKEIDTTKAKIFLIEGMNRILPPYPEDLSQKAKESLEYLGVTVLTNRMVTNIEKSRVNIRYGEEEETIKARTILWAAGVKASSLGKIIVEKTNAESDRVGRIIVEPNLSIKDYPNIFVVGDLANFSHQDNKPLPGIAPVAMAQGQYMSKYIKAQIKGETIPPFRYVDKGSLAVIGDNHAVVNLGFMKLSGFIAWLVWVFAHIYYLIEFDSKLVVMIEWGWNYITRGRGARLITGEISEKNLINESFNNDHYASSLTEKEKVEV